METKVTENTVTAIGTNNKNSWMFMQDATQGLFAFTDKQHTDYFDNGLATGEPIFVWVVRNYHPETLLIQSV